MTSALLAAADPAKTTSGGSAVVQVIFFGAIFAGMYFLLLRPQRKRMKEAAALQASISDGDEVVLNSGMYGFVSAVEGDIVWLDIADGHGEERIEVRVTRSAVARKIVPTETK
ncbi:MAG: preprotein translocase subunit YajC [Actinomycetota bacterium]